MLIAASTLFEGQEEPIQTDGNRARTCPRTLCSTYQLCKPLGGCSRQRGRLSCPDETQGNLCLLKSVSCFWLRKQVLEQDNQVIGS